MSEYPDTYSKKKRNVSEEKKAELERLIQNMQFMRSLCKDFSTDMNDFISEYFRILGLAELYDVEIVRDKTRQNMTAIQDAIREIQNNVSFVRRFLCEMQHDMGQACDA